MAETFVIALGNPFDGIVLYAGPDGLPFRSAEDAALEAERRCRGDDWSVVGLESSADPDTPPAGTEGG